MVEVADDSDAHEWFLLKACQVCVDRSGRCLGSFTDKVQHIVCTSVGGPVGHRLSWRVTVDGLVSRSPSTSTKQPVIERVYGSMIRLHTGGGELVTIVGANLGVEDGSGELSMTTCTKDAVGRDGRLLPRRQQQCADRVGEVTYGPTAAEYTARDCRLIRPGTHLACRTAPGVGQLDFMWRVQIGSQWSGLSGSFLGYSSPVVESMRSEEGILSSGGLLTITGAQLGFEYSRVFANSVHVAWGTTQLEILSFNPTNLTAIVPAAVQPVANVTVSHHVRTKAKAVAEIVRSEGRRMSVQAPSIESLRVLRLDHGGTPEDTASWALEVELIGSSLGLEGTLRFDGEIVPRSRISSWDHSAIRFTVPAHQDAALVVVTASGQDSRVLEWSCSSVGSQSIGRVGQSADECALSSIGNGVCDRACQTAGCAHDGLDCVECGKQSSPQLLARNDLLVAENEPAGTPAHGLAIGVSCPGICDELTGRPCGHVAYALVGVQGCSMSGGASLDAFALETMSNTTVRVVTTVALDFESCDEYVLEIEASNGGGRSSAQFGLKVLNVNDARIDEIHRDDGGSLDSFPTRGDTRVVFTGEGLGRMDPGAEMKLSARYAGHGQTGEGWGLIKVSRALSSQLRL